MSLSQSLRLFVILGPDSALPPDYGPLFSRYVIHIVGTDLNINVKARTFVRINCENCRVIYPSDVIRRVLKIREIVRKMANFNSCKHVQRNSDSLCVCQYLFRCWHREIIKFHHRKKYITWKRLLRSIMLRFTTVFQMHKWRTSNGVSGSIDVIDTTSTHRGDCSIFATYDSLLLSVIYETED